ncbi:hypothetical protein VA7868_03581 [Vibrio aerogenes CECT 7868]|uniref:Lipoprotein n=1 Tax=Vibrio aerogenes CECT 7868 TaxID=1216006 RepID=A0A1M6AIB7_9VIBR|nr:hypothetical protein [Vibrio aerogenes]SHI36058.1 hypothetical protein VA7868_03581 [Vibrio aerogenes CECT 7868]
MNAAINFASAILVAFILTSCAAIDHTSKVKQKTGQPLFAGVGDIVVSIDRERNLENAFGKSDIFGRKTKEGYTEIRFAGIEPDGTVVLYRKDISIISNETTMSRTPISNTTGYSQTNVTGSANTFGNQTSLNVSGNTTYNATTIGPAEDYHIAVPSDTIPIRLKPNEKVLPVSGYLIRIGHVTPNSIEYRVEQQPN